MNGLTLVSGQRWVRPQRPLLSNSPPAQPWLKCALYAPRVIFAQGKFHLWFTGGAQRPVDYIESNLGYAHSPDGFHWTLHPNNPILRGRDLPVDAAMLSTPWVLFDEERSLYEMWCGVSERITERREGGYARDQREKLMYATSRDGLRWDFHPRPLLEGIRSPCVRKENGRYRMWINDRPRPEQDHLAAYAHVYEYHSDNGIHWRRMAQPAIKAGGNTRTCVYPCVLKLKTGYYLWHIGHLLQSDGPPFEIFCDRSADGTTWRTEHHVPAYAASRDPDRFDYRFVSTPCVIQVGDELRLYHAASNLTTSFNEFEGRDDGVGVHLAVAVMKTSDLA